MKQFDTTFLRELYIPPPNSHKGENGKLLMIAGSQLFHAASLFSLTVASRIVDMVYYSSVTVNNEIVKEEKKEFRNGIIIPRSKIEAYIEEADCILIGPGLPRLSGLEKGDDDTGELTSSLLKKYPKKRWVIDGGSLQTIDPKVIPPTAILTPHKKEFEILFKVKSDKQQMIRMAEKYNCVILLKGPVDIISNGTETIEIKGGNAGMTKGGTGDVLAGLVASLYCKNEAFLSALAGSYINKKAGEALFKKVGYYFNASDLANEIPKVMKQYALRLN